MDKVKEFLKRLGLEILKFLKQVVIIFTKYVIANIIDSILVGILMLVLMLIFRVPHPIILSVLAGFFNAIPAIGPVIGAVIGMIVLVFIDWKFALLYMVLTIVIQAIDSYIIKPKLFGDTMGVHPVLMLIIILIASLVGGIPGALLAAPIAGVVVFIFRAYIKPAIKKLKERKSETPRIEGPTIYDEPTQQPQETPVIIEEREGMPQPALEQTERTPMPVTMPTAMPKASQNAEERKKDVIEAALKVTEATPKEMEVISETMGTVFEEKQMTSEADQTIPKGGDGKNESDHDPE